VRRFLVLGGARIAVIASETAPERLPYADSDRGPAGDWRANIVFTLARKGECFGRFFHRLFSRMQDGMSMPMAWVELAPQGPVQPEDIPEAICLPEAGHIAFGKPA
jgi:hypothetical protein